MYSKNPYSDVNTIIFIIALVACAIALAIAVIPVPPGV